MPDTKNPECNFLEKIDPEFASEVAQACADHDEAYHNRTGWPQCDWQWVKDAYQVNKFKAVLYGTPLLLGGWFLYYDLDKVFKN